MKKSTSGSSNKLAKLKIGLVFDDSLDRPDGVQQQVKLLGSWLAQRGHQVRYLVGETNLKQIDGQKVYSLSKNVAVRANQNRLSLPRPVKPALVNAVLEQEKFDILHVMLPFSPFLGRVVVKAAQRNGITLVGTFHTHPASIWQTVGSWLYGWVIRGHLRRFACLMSVSPATKLYVRQTFGVDSLVVPNFIDTKRFSAGQPRPELANNGPCVVFLSRLVKRKGPQHLLEAVGRLKRQNRFNDAQLVICGQGPLKSRLERRIAELGLKEQTVMAGFIAEHDKADYLASADLAVFPSSGGEAFGIVLIEAMAAGALTVGGDNAGYRSVLGARPQLLVDPRDHVALAERIDKLLGGGPEVERLKHWQSSEVQRYDVETVGRQIEQFYRQARL